MLREHVGIMGRTDRVHPLAMKPFGIGQKRESKKSRFPKERRKARERKGNRLKETAAAQRSLTDRRGLTADS